jgi:hypothetical protein
MLIQRREIIKRSLMRWSDYAAIHFCLVAYAQNRVWQELEPLEPTPTVGWSPDGPRLHTLSEPGHAQQILPLIHFRYKWLKCRLSTEISV